MVESAVHLITMEAKVPTDSNLIAEVHQLTNLQPIGIIQDPHSLVIATPKAITKLAGFVADSELTEGYAEKNFFTLSLDLSTYIIFVELEGNRFLIKVKGRPAMETWITECYIRSSRGDGAALVIPVLEQKYFGIYVKKYKLVAST